MIIEGLLKNATKFNNIKLAKGKNLVNLGTKRRSIRTAADIGLSTQSYGHLWFVTPKGKGLFKTYDDYFAEKVRNIRIINELLCKKLCDQIGIECAEYEQASIEDENGVITYDIFGDKKVVNICDFVKIVDDPSINLLDCEKAIDIYRKKGFILDKEEIMTSLYKYILFDTLTLQADRNIQNLVFLLDKKSKTFTISKLFDNEFAFFTEGILTRLKTRSEQELRFDDIITNHSWESKIFSIINSYSPNAQRFYNNIFYLVLFANKHESLMEILNFALENFNPPKAFDELENEGNEINPDYKQYVCDLTESVKQKIIHEKDDVVSQSLLEETENLF